MKNQILNFIILGILFILSFGFSKAVTAATRTVSSSSELQSALGVSGDVIQIRGGTYNGGFTVSGSNMTIKNYPGETPILDAGNGSVPLRVNGSNNTIEGLIIRNSNDSCVWLTGSGHKIRNNEVYNCTQGGIVMWDAGGHFLIEGNRIHDWLGKDNWDGIEIHGTNCLVVKNNVLWSPGPGIGDFIDAGSLESNIHHIVYDGNTAYCTGSCLNNPYESKIKINKVPTRSILRRNTITGTSFTFYVKPFKEVAIYNNTAVNCLNNCIMFWQDGDGPSGWGGVSVKNNIFAYSGGYLLQHSRDAADGAWPSIRMDHNVYRFSNQAIIWAMLSGESNYGTSLAEYNRWRTVTGQEPSGGKYSTQSLSQLFASLSTTDFRLASGGDAIDAGGALTKTRSSGSGTVVPVDDSFYFFDGYGLTDGDTIQIGSNVVKVIAVGEAAGNNTVTIDRSITWSAGDGVSLPYNGAAPDAGAIEYGSGGSTGPAPTPSSSGGSILKGDLNNDKIVNSLDWSIMNGRWFTNDTAADLNIDGIVNSLDFSIMNGNWLKSV